MQNAEIPVTVVALTFASPAPTAVTTPFSTFTADGLLEVQVSERSVESAGATLTLRVAVAPGLIYRSFSAMLT